MASLTERISLRMSSGLSKLLRTISEYVAAWTISFLVISTQPDQASLLVQTGASTAAMERDATLSAGPGLDRKSTRLNSSHVKISYAVFCLKKKIHIAVVRSTAISLIFKTNKNQS